MSDSPASTTSALGRPARPVLSRKDSPQATGTATVTVACNLPNGYTLRVFDMVEVNEATPMGFRTMTEARERGRHTLNGNAIDMEALKQRRMPPYLIVEGYALTTGVPSELWEKWHRDNQHSDIVMNGIIFAMRDDTEARNEALKMKGVESGLEPIDPADPGRKTGIRGIEPGTRTNITA